MLIHMSQAEALRWVVYKSLAWQFSTNKIVWCVTWWRSFCFLNCRYEKRSHPSHTTPFWTPPRLRYFFIHVGQFHNFVFRSCGAKRETADLQVVWRWCMYLIVDGDTVLSLRVYYPSYRHGQKHIQQTIFFLWRHFSTSSGVETLLSTYTARKTRLRARFTDMKKGRNHGGVIKNILSRL